MLRDFYFIACFPSFCRLLHFTDKLIWFGKAAHFQTNWQKFRQPGFTVIAKEKKEAKPGWMRATTRHPWQTHRNADGSFRRLRWEILSSVRLECQSALLLRHPRLIEASQRSRAPHQLWKLGSFNELRLSLGSVYTLLKYGSVWEEWAVVFCNCDINVHQCTYIGEGCLLAKPCCWQRLAHFEIWWHEDKHTNFRWRPCLNTL